MLEDTPEAMAAWVAAGRRVAIFSSGSREAPGLMEVGGLGFRVMGVGGFRGSGGDMRGT